MLTLYIFPRDSVGKTRGRGGERWKEWGEKREGGRVGEGGGKGGRERGMREGERDKGVCLCVCVCV